MFDRVLLPVAPFLISGVTALIALYWLIVLRSELVLLRSRVKREAKRCDEQAQDSARRIAEISARLDEMEARNGNMFVPSPPKSGLNVTKRTQVLRLSRRGDDPKHIASALSLPRREVELLLKVQRLSAEKNAR